MSICITRVYGCSKDNMVPFGTLTFLLLEIMVTTRATPPETVYIGERFGCHSVLLYICIFYITHVHFYKNNVNIKYVDANLDARDNVISGNEPSSEMLTSQSQIP